MEEEYSNVCRAIENPDDVLCIDCDTGKVILLWVNVYDLFSPVEWQLESKIIADDLVEYLKFQMSMY